MRFLLKVWLVTGKGWFLWWWKKCWAWWKWSSWRSTWHQGWPGSEGQGNNRTERGPPLGIAEQAVIIRVFLVIIVIQLKYCRPLRCTRLLIQAHLNSCQLFMKCFWVHEESSHDHVRVPVQILKMIIVILMFMRTTISIYYGQRRSR